MINIYCDESCHLSYDNENTMVLGAMHFNNKYKDCIYKDIRNLKIKHGLNSRFEIKWTKVSESKVEFYEDLLDYYFSTQELYFRTLIVKDKNKLNHDKYNNGSHDLWYYKMYYYLLEPLISRNYDNRVFIDIKDTRGGPRILKLYDVLTNSLYDYNDQYLKRIDQIDSVESEVLQLADLIIGMISYYHRNLHLKEDANQGKVILLNKLINDYNINLSKSTIKREEKFNIFLWEPREDNVSDFYEK